MADAEIRRVSGVLPSAKPMADGFGVHAAEQVSIEVDRLSFAMQDGAEAAQAASKNCGGLLMDTYVRALRGSMRSGVEVGDHVLALWQAKTVAEAFRMNVEFLHKQMSSAQERLFELAGVKGEAREARPGPGA